MGMMIAQLDRLLRSHLPAQDQPPGSLPIPRLLAYCLVLGGIYGVFMGLYSPSMNGAAGAMQVLASAIKVPMLFLLTLAVTFPSMYVFSAMAGSRLDPRRALAIMLESLVVTLALAASFAPIVGFFTISTTSYHFMVVLNVGFLACAGIAGSASLARNLRRLHLPSPVLNEAHEAVHSPRDAALGVFSVWIALYGIVGAQMGWVLRPFIGAPGEPFAWFRERSGHILSGVARTLVRLAGLES